jgi:Flp pilus assembly protein TadG/uncharacterized membrane protein (UPF0127 family)
MRVVTLINKTRGTVLGDRIKVADTSLRRVLGLLGRRGLDDGEGLWIRPSSGVHTVGMKFPIDVVGMDKELRVVKVWPRLVPYRITSVDLDIRSVVELSAGRIEGERVMVGDQMQIVESIATLSTRPAELLPPRSIEKSNITRRMRTCFQSVDDHGQSLVEFAVCLPVLLLVVTGICTFGIALNNYLMLTNSVSVGARLLAISRGQTTDPCLTTATAVYAAAPILKKTSLTFTFVLDGTSYAGTTCSSGSTTTGAAGKLVQGTSAQVTVTYPCSLVVYGVNYAPSCSLKAQTTELVQ